MLRGIHRFEGRLIDGQKPARGWSVQLRLAQDWDEPDWGAEDDPVWTTTPNAEGRFAFTELPHGRYVLTALRASNRSIAFDSVLVPSAGEYVFDVGSREFPIEGVIKDSDTDAGIANATVRVQSDAEGWSRCDTFRTDARGRFSGVVGNLCSWMRVEAQGYAAREILVKPSVPSPAPTGSESADDMQVSTDIPYIIAAIGFFSTFCS